MRSLLSAGLLLAFFLWVVRTFLFLVSRLTLAGLSLSRIMPWLIVLFLPAVRLIALLLPLLISLLIMFLIVHEYLHQVRNSWPEIGCGCHAMSPLLTENGTCAAYFECMIRKLKNGEYRLYSMKKNPKTGRRRNLGTFSTRADAEKHERAVQYFKRAG